MENGSSRGFAVVIVEHSAEFIAAADGRPRGLVLVAPGKAQEQGKRKWKLLERTQWVLQSHPEKLATTGSESCVVVREGGTKRRQ